MGLLVSCRVVIIYVPGLLVCCSSYCMECTLDYLQLVDLAGLVGLGLHGFEFPMELWVWRFDSCV